MEEIHDDVDLRTTGNEIVSREDRKIEVLEGEVIQLHVSDICDSL